ncbi:MAG TPA: hypothetical protein VHO46_00395 [Bacteroidales bacterium]|nr:hypothetical protein [Bacteroidales bacterium]
MKKKPILLVSFFAAAVMFSCEKNDSGSGPVPVTKMGTSDGILNECETAFARKTSLSHAFCFTTLDLDGDNKPDFNRWGWSNGPLIEGTSTWYNLYAAAGQCDPDKGALAGRMDVHYYNGTVSIVLSVKTGYTLDETHLYVGNEIVPRLPNGKYTVAPGQYPYSHDLDGAKADYYTVENVSGSIYVIMHAIVCGS